MVDRSAMSSMIGIRSSSSRKCKPPGEAPTLPWQYVQGEEAENQSISAYDYPEDAFQLVDDFEVLAFETVCANEVGELLEVTFFVQNLATQLGLRYFAVEMPRSCPFKSSTRWDEYTLY